jgi:GNAT superfamily N-acetyltransferase
MIPSHVFATYFYPDVFPVEAGELLGGDVEKAWEDAREGGPGRIPVLIGATTDGQWLAGVLMFLETLEGEWGGSLKNAREEHPHPSPPPEGEGAGRVEHVASIRLLVVGRQYQNAGLAGFLIRRALKIAERQGCARVRTTAGFGCTDHVIMYERLGFAKTKMEEYPYRYSRALESARE